MDSTTTKVLSALGIQPSSDHLSRLARFKSLLYQENQKLNLTRIPETEFFKRHVVDSLLLLPFLKILQPESVLDFGSGAGLPGVPLAIFLETCEFWLYDKSPKKTQYLRKVECLSPNIRVITELNRQFDIVVSRAVAKTSELIKLTHGLYKKLALSLKSRHVLDELSQGRPKLHVTVYQHILEDYDFNTHVLVYGVEPINLTVPNFTQVFST